MSAHDSAGHHIVPLRVYFGVFAALLFLTVMTVVVAYADVDVWLRGPEAENSAMLANIVALVIATTKATLVVLFFMHLKYSPRLTQVVVVGAIVWLVILLTLTLSDYASRGWLGWPGT